MIKPYIYLIEDKIKLKPYYVGKHNGENKNYITGSKILRRYISIFGLKSFFNRFNRTIIEYTNNDIINNREEYYIKLFNTKNDGGNLTWGGRYDVNIRKVKIKPVLQYSINGNFIKEWKCGRDIWREGIVKSYPDISACCLGKQPTAGGYVWKYKQENIPLLITPLQRKQYKKGVKRIKNKSVEINFKIYPSITAAAKDLGFTFGKLNWDIKHNKIKHNKINYI